MKVCAICLLTKSAGCGIMEFRGAAGESAPSKCTKIFNIFKNFCAFCTLYNLHNSILTNQPPHFLYKITKSIGKVNKLRLLSLFILPIDFQFLYSFNKGRKAVRGKDVQGLLRFLLKRYPSYRFQFLSQDGHNNHSNL